MVNRRNSGAYHAKILNTIGVVIDSESLEESNPDDDKNCNATGDRNGVCCNNYYTLENEDDDAGTTPNEAGEGFESAEDETPTSGYGELGMTDEINDRENAIRTVASRLALINLSKSELEVVIQMSKLIQMFDISALEIHAFNKKTVEEFANPRTIRLCSSCHRCLANQLSRCKNNDCPLFGLKTVRGSSSQQTVISSFSVANQMKKIITSQMHILLATHRDHHRKKEDSLGSFHKSRKYRENIESIDQFNSQHLVLPVSIAYDGFVPSNLSKSEITPLYVRIEGVPNEQKEQEASIVLAAVHTGPGGVSWRNANVFVSRFIAELEEFRMTPLQIEFRNEIWTVEAKVVMTLTDAKASRNVSGFPNWSAEDECTNCDIIGTRFNRSGVSFFSNLECNLRTEASLNVLIKQKGKENALTELVSPLNQPLDELHVISEGVFKRLINDLLGNTQNWKNLKLPVSVVEEFDNCLRKINRNTESRSQFVSFSKIGKLTGSQIKQMSRIVFTLIAVEPLYGDVFTNAFFFVLVYYVDSLFSVENTDQLELISEMRDFLKSFIGCRYEDKFTWKTHMLLDHAVSKVEEYGNLRGTSTAPFEKCHRVISVQYNQYSTNVEHMCNTFLLKSALTDRKMSEKLSVFQLSSDVSAYSNYKIRSPKCDEFQWKAPGPAKFWKRIFYKDVLLSSSSWERKGESMSSMEFEDEIVIGIPDVFFSCEEGVFVILRKLEIKNGMHSLCEQAYEKGNPAIVELLEKLRECNSWIFKIGNETNCVTVPIENYRRKFISLQFREKIYAIESLN